MLQSDERNFISTEESPQIDRREKCDTQSLGLPKSSTAFHERPATGSITATYEQQNPTNSNRPWNLVRDQGVGGSNPLSPTIIFNHLQSIPGPPPSAM